MAINDGAVLLPGVGHIFTGVVATATKPTLTALTTFAADVSAGIGTGWSNFGHTDLDDILAPGQDGGDTEVKGSWQNKSLREIVTAETVDYLVIKSLQIKDNDVLTLYYGGGDATVANEFALPDNPVPQERAVTIAMLDGAVPTALYIPRVSIRREDSMEFASDDFTKAPLRFTYLKKTGAKKAIWIDDLLGASS